MPLISVIVSPSRTAYFAAMPAGILKLLTLLALALMPFGMSAASATSTHHAPAASAPGHCEEQDGLPQEQIPDQFTGCTAACSMFMGEEARLGDGLPLIGPPVSRPIAPRWASLHPETATPPPKLS